MIFPSFLLALPKEEFQKQIAAQQKLLTPTKAVAVPRRRNVRTTAKISCKNCGQYLGDMSDVRKYGQSHFLIMDGSLHERVKPFPDTSFMKPMDGES